MKSCNKKDVETYKIILLGSAGVGKTNLLKVLIDFQFGFSDFYPPTLSPEYGVIYLPHPDGTPEKIIKVKIWDTVGQERYRALAKTHYRKADGAILVFDVGDPKSFEEVEDYMEEIDETLGDSLAVVMLVMNQIDKLPKGSKALPRGCSPVTFVQEEDVEAYWTANNLMYARTSAKYNNNAFEWDGQSIQAVVSDVVHRIHLHKSQESFCVNSPNTIKLGRSYTEELEPGCSACGSQASLCS